MIPITPNLAIGEEELVFQFVRASGPGGQNVNKTSTAVQLRFDAAHCPSLPEEVRSRLRGLAGRRMTVDGVVVIEASRHRSQRQNRDEALQRLVSLLRAAAHKGKRRRPTAPSVPARERRLQHKRSRSLLKRQRHRPHDADG